ncbi:MAG: hypothetical protein IJ240_01870 [Clostridia bacterium]|nr:hypothetical protein [Clostridia bacterium]
MASYNDIGIGEDLDWARIRKLFMIGLLGALMTLAGDMMLGWGVHDPAQGGMEGFLSAYVDLPDAKIFWSAFLGFLGIPLEALAYFGVYRLIAPFSRKQAHLYRSSILGMLAFGGCGVHVPCLASVFFYKYMHIASPETALEWSVRFGLYFLLPGMVFFMVFWLIHQIAHVGAFAKGLTPYPRQCWIFCPAVGMALTMLLKFLPETALRNALTAAWISIGNLWMFGGLLIMMNQAKSKGRA